MPTQAIRDLLGRGSMPRTKRIGYWVDTKSG